MLSPSAFADDIAWNGGGLNVRMGSMYGHTHVRGRGRVHIARAWAVSPRTARAHTQAQAPCTPHACTRARGRRAATRAWYEMRMSVQRRLLAPRTHAHGRIHAHTPPAHQYRFHVYNVVEMLSCRHATEGEAIYHPNCIRLRHRERCPKGGTCSTPSTAFVGTADTRAPRRHG